MEVKSYFFHLIKRSHLSDGSFLYRIDFILSTMKEFEFSQLFYRGQTVSVELSSVMYSSSSLPVILSGVQLSAGITQDYTDWYLILQYPDLKIGLNADSDGASLFESIESLEVSVPVC